MFDSCLVRQCAPTLAGVKVGNLFCIDVVDKALLREVLAHWNNALNPKGVFVCIVAGKNGRSFIYVYRKSALSSLAYSSAVQAFLRDFGYKAFDIESLLNSFQLRLSSSLSFPHEVGIFLGYPLDDVRDFIAYEGRDYKCIGCWKVYNDVKNSTHIFEVYKKCKQVLWNKFEQGISLDRLTVAS